MDPDCAATALFRYCGALLWLVKILPVLWSPLAPGLFSLEQQPCSYCSLRELYFLVPPKCGILVRTLSSRSLENVLQ